MVNDAKQEKILLQRCITGDPDAWTEFVSQYSPLIYFVIKKVLHTQFPGTGRDVLDELHNEVFLSLMENRGKKLSQYQGKNGCSVSTWLRVIAVRMTIDYFRKRRHDFRRVDCTAESPLDNSPADHTNPLAVMEDKEQRRILHELMEELSPKDQMFLRLLYFEEKTPAFLAQFFHTSTNAIYSRGNYLREKLKSALQKKVSQKQK